MPRGRSSSRRARRSARWRDASRSPAACGTGPITRWRSAPAACACLRAAGGRHVIVVPAASRGRRRRGHGPAGALRRSRVGTDDPGSHRAHGVPAHAPTVRARCHAAPAARRPGRPTLFALVTGGAPGSVFKGHLSGSIGMCAIARRRPLGARVGGGPPEDPQACFAGLRSGPTAPAAALRSGDGGLGTWPMHCS